MGAQPPVCNFGWKAIRERLIRDCVELKTLGVNAVAISSNDPDDYPEDSFENMQRVARDLKFPFPCSIKWKP